MKPPRKLVFIALALVAAVAIGLCLRQWVIAAVRVAGTSMQDTLRGGDVALVTRFDYAHGRAPERGDVVVCRFPDRGGTYIKRVVGLPGETVTFTSGALCVNGEAVDEPYVSSPTDDFRAELGENEYLVLGDNRAESYDSRMPDMGPVGAEAFIGRVRCVIWPPAHIGGVK